MGGGGDGRGRPGRWGGGHGRGGAHWQRTQQVHTSIQLKLNMGQLVKPLQKQCGYEIC
jgi:hypothetical protein